MPKMKVGILQDFWQVWVAYYGRVGTYLGGNAQVFLTVPPQWWPFKKRRILSAFYRPALLYLFLNFPNVKHIAYLYNRSIAYLAGMKMNHRKSDLHLLFKCIDYMYFFLLPLFRYRSMIIVHSKSKQISHIHYRSKVLERLLIQGFFAYLYCFLHCRIRVKTSKLWNNTQRII